MTGRLRTLITWSSAYKTDLRFLFLQIPWWLCNRQPKCQQRIARSGLAGVPRFGLAALHVPLLSQTRPPKLHERLLIQHQFQRSILLKFASCCAFLIKPVRKKETHKKKCLKTDKMTMYWTGQERCCTSALFGIFFSKSSCDIFKWLWVFKSCTTCTVLSQMFADMLHGVEVPEKQNVNSLVRTQVLW